jgi:tripartite-type tricarboxylate transporter receptor subunit TctC
VNRIAFVLAFALVAIASPAAAQDYPSRPVRIVVPFPPGGGADLNARVFADRLSKLWNQQALVENMSGAGGGIAAVNVARSKPDGYTVFFATHPIFAINPFMYDKLAYDPDADFSPVIKLSEAPLVLLVPASSGVRSVSDLIRLAKEKPGAINFGSGGVGTSQHLTAELFKATAGIEITHVPYRGTAPASVALLGNEIQMHFDSVGSALTQAKTGRVRAIAITGQKRLPTAPDLPTMSETLNGFESTLAYTFFVPAGTPQKIVSVLNRDANKVVQEPKLRKQMEDEGIILQGGTPEQLKAYLASERRKWGELLKRLNIKAT